MSLGCCHPNCWSLLLAHVIGSHLLFGRPWTNDNLLTGQWKMWKSHWSHSITLGNFWYACIIQVMIIFKLTCKFYTTCISHWNHYVKYSRVRYNAVNGRAKGCLLWRFWTKIYVISAPCMLKWGCQHASWFLCYCRIIIKSQQPFSISKNVLSPNLTSTWSMVIQANCVINHHCSNRITSQQQLTNVGQSYIKVLIMWPSHGLCCLLLSQDSITKRGYISSEVPTRRSKFFMSLKISSCQENIRAKLC